MTYSIETQQKKWSDCVKIQTTFYSVSSYSKPVFRIRNILDADPAPHLALFISDLQDPNKVFMFIPL